MASGILTSQQPRKCVGGGSTKYSGWWLVARGGSQMKPDPGVISKPKEEECGTMRAPR